ncbi:hypothetical protein Sjap_022486 [Stephania japonica]|uniref:Probable purine permease n=1 Tax=Stephania japonica TaxID=461633 RepID=A0AAP0HSV4_9MAGN
MRTMEIVDRNTTDEPTGTVTNKSQNGTTRPWLLLLFNCMLVTVGGVSSPLLLRCYYLHGGNRKWLASWLQNVAFPLFLIPISAPLLLKRQSNNTNYSHNLSHFVMNKRLFYASVTLGVLYGASSFCMALGLRNIPVSTSTLLMATQLAFTAVFAFLMVKQRFTAFSVNAVVLLMLGSVILGLHSSGDRPSGVSNGEYVLGFVMTLAAAASLGFILPFVELSYKKAGMVSVTYGLVMQVQFVSCLVATIFCTVPMIVNHDFQAIRREGKEYGLGETKYYLVLTFTAIATQATVMGNLGVIFCSSSLFTGVLQTMLLPVQQVFAVIFFKEKFNSEKGISLVLALWGFISYFYGEYKLMRNNTQRQPSVNGHENVIQHIVVQP